MLFGDNADIITKKEAVILEQTFLTELRIEKVRHLQDITIPLSETERKNLILTGKNGCGKTSVLKSLAEFLKYIISYSYRPKEKTVEYIQLWEKELLTCDNSESGRSKREHATKQLEYFKCDFRNWSYGCTAQTTSFMSLRDKYAHSQFVMAFYSDNRQIDVAKYKDITKVDLKPVYEIQDKPAKDLGKYLVNLKSTQAFAQTKGDLVRANEIENWFNRFEGILKELYQDDSLYLDFDIDTFQFSIHISGREPFDFNTMSMGYAAVLDIICDLIMRMESQRRYDLEGIVLIDEIETHLHVELQKQIVPILTKLFPNIQFILTTHSPFILNSAPNAVIYDLEKHLLVSEGMENLSYEGIVEGYFGVDAYSKELRDAFEEYKSLVTSSELSDVQRARLAALRDYLDEVPDYLAREIAYEYSLLRLEYDD